MGAKTVSAKGDHHQRLHFLCPFSPWKICLTDIFSNKYIRLITAWPKNRRNPNFNELVEDVCF